MTSASSATGSPVTSRQVLEMLTVANDFTLFIEKAEGYTQNQILQYLHRILPAIYLKSSLLPDSEVTDDDAVEHYVTEEQWENVFNTLRGKFGTEDEYYYVDLQEKSHHDTIHASISENLADMYQDLKDFVLLYQNPLHAFKENAVKECRRLFQSRFGFRLVNCHAALHYILYREGTFDFP